MTMMLKFNIAVPSTTIKMKDKPTEKVLPNTIVTLMCETDSGNPPPKIYWDIPGSTPLMYNILQKTEQGQFNGSITISTVHINVTKQLDEQITKCSLRGSDDISDQYTWNVKCEQHFILP